MQTTEVLIKKTETLPPALFEEAVHYIDYLSQKAQSVYFAKKLAEAEHEAAKPNAVWLDENKFWGKDDRNTQSVFLHLRNKIKKR